MDKYFERYNPNPLDKETGDCVVRALCATTRQSWLNIFDILCNFARAEYTMPNNSEVYSKAFKYFGFKQKTIPRPKKGQKSMDVQKFCETHSDGTYIIKTARHVIGVVQGKYYDLYPNYGQKVYTYYELES